VDVDDRQVVGRCLDRITIVVGLHEFAPAGGRASGRCERGRWFEGFAEMRENPADRRWFRDEGNQLNVSATRRALEWFMSGRKRAASWIP
jgi:hypothetical protein